MCSRLYYPGSCKYTFARRNRLTTHFSERIPVVKRRIFVQTSGPQPGDTQENGNLMCTLCPFRCYSNITLSPFNRCVIIMLQKIHMFSSLPFILYNVRVLRKVQQCFHLCNASKYDKISHIKDKNVVLTSVVR